MLTPEPFSPLDLPKTFYVCPGDLTPMQSSSAALLCPSCGRRYPITPEGIAQLDIVCSEQAREFDAKYVNYSGMSTNELATTRRVASGFIELAMAGSRGPIQKICDLACGKGELTVGLALSPAIGDAKIFAFDHSLGSLVALDRTIRQIGLRHRVELSQQDAFALGYEEGSFDLVLGNAVLHHFLDVPKFLRSVWVLLRSRGVAIFAEPCAEGYVLVVTLLRMAARMAGLSARDEVLPEMGLYRFIVEDIERRIQHQARPETLADLVDKHLFSLPQMLGYGNKLGFEVGFENVENPSYYEAFFDDVVNTYRITHPDLIRHGREIYSQVRRTTGAEFCRLYPHFRYFIFTRKD